MTNEDLILRYLLKAFDDEQRLDFEQRLAASEEMRKELREYQEVFDTLGLVEAEKRPTSLDQRFYAMLDASMKADCKPKETKIISFWSWQKIAAAASILLIGVFIGQQIQQRPVESEFDRSTFTKLVKQARTSQRISGIHMVEQSKSLDEEVISVLYDLLLNDASTNVRLAVVETFALHMTQEEVRNKLLIAIKEINKPVIKIGIIQALSGSSKNQQSIFEELLESEMDEAVREELHVAIMRS